MKKLLWLLIALPTFSYAQVYSVDNNGKRNLLIDRPGIYTKPFNQIQRLISIDTTVLKEGSKLCSHLFQSANAEIQEKGSVYAVMHIQPCLPETEDRLICAKCLRHVKVVYHNECITGSPYSELLKLIERDAEHH